MSQEAPQRPDQGQMLAIKINGDNKPKIENTGSYIVNPQNTLSSLKEMIGSEQSITGRNEDTGEQIILRPERLRSAEQPGSSEYSKQDVLQKIKQGGKKVVGHISEDDRRHFENPDINPQKGKQLKAVITMLVEMIPGGIGPWGVGDIVTAIEAVAGRTIDGLHLSISERIIYLGASAIPVVPARPILGAYRWAKHQYYQSKQHNQLPEPK